MSNDKALNIIWNMIRSLEDSSSSGEELEWALDQSGDTKQDLYDAMAQLGDTIKREYEMSWELNPERMGQ